MRLTQVFQKRPLTGPLRNRCSSNCSTNISVKQFQYTYRATTALLKIKPFQNIFTDVVITSSDLSKIRRKLFGKTTLDGYFWCFQTIVQTLIYHYDYTSLQVKYNLEVVPPRYSMKKPLLKISHKSQRRTCSEAFFEV